MCVPMWIWQSLHAITIVMISHTVAHGPGFWKITISKSYSLASIRAYTARQSCHEVHFLVIIWVEVDLPRTKVVNK